MEFETTNLKLPPPIRSMFQLSQEMHRFAMSNDSLADLQRAEELLVRAANEGHEKAKNWLRSTWPLLKAATEKRLARGMGSDEPS